MTEAEIFNNFYEGMTPKSKDLVNSSSGGDFSRLRAYDNPRAQSNRRAPVHAATDQADDKMEARMDRFEKTILNALEKNKQPAPAEKCQAPLGQEEAYGQMADGCQGKEMPRGGSIQISAGLSLTRFHYPNQAMHKRRRRDPNGQAETVRGQTAGIEARATSLTGQAEMRRTSMGKTITTRVQEGTSTIPKRVEITTISKDHLEIPSTTKGTVSISKEEDQTSNIQSNKTSISTIWWGIC
ncbi:hypothetical protein AAHA92_17022 [Salvia divinorum]|uniref:Uncharacterized protein n=1 Tax=Salvia divinorum TaxID=28513 RepID=A0ABD1H0D8_SALDI